MESPRRSPRIAERNGAAPRRHVALGEGEGHPQAEMFRVRREVADMRAQERRTLCLVTMVFGAMWLGFFGSLAVVEWKEGRLPFAWEMHSGWLNP